MTALLLRHAPTAGNLKKRYVGSTDEPLCEEGIRMARACGEAPRVGKVYVSPRARAAQSAGLWYPRAELIAVNGLEEMDFGVFEGRSHDEMAGDPAYSAWLDSNCEAACPGGEDKASFSDRACEAFLRVVERAGGDFILVAHGGVLMAVLDRFAVEKRGYFAWGAPPCEGYRVRVEGSGEGLSIASAERARGGETP